jgi:hypothetical protein
MTSVDILLSFFCYYHLKNKSTLLKGSKSGIKKADDIVQSRTECLAKIMNVIFLFILFVFMRPWKQFGRVWKLHALLIFIYLCIPKKDLAKYHLCMSNMGFLKNFYTDQAQIYSVVAEPWKRECPRYFPKLPLLAVHLATHKSTFATFHWSVIYNIWNPCRCMV